MRALPYALALSLSLVHVQAPLQVGLWCDLGPVTLPLGPNVLICKMRGRTRLTDPVCVWYPVL